MTAKTNYKINNDYQEKDFYNSNSDAYKSKYNS